MVSMPAMEALKRIPLAVTPVDVTTGRTGLRRIRRIDVFSTGTSRRRLELASILVDTSGPLRHAARQLLARGLAANVQLLGDNDARSARFQNVVKRRVDLPLDVLAQPALLAAQLLPAQVEFADAGGFFVVALLLGLFGDLVQLVALASLIAHIVRLPGQCPAQLDAVAMAQLVGIDFAHAGIQSARLARQRRLGPDVCRDVYLDPLLVEVEHDAQIALDLPMAGQGDGHAILALQAHDRDV